MTVSVIILIAALFAVSPNGKDLGHNGLPEQHCIECHTRLPFADTTPPLRKGVSGLCGTCHQRPHGGGQMRSHPVSTLPSMRVPPDMILDHKGRVACVTCHAFHGEYRDENGNKRFYLRRSRGKVFCYSCHKKLPGLIINKGN